MADRLTEVKELITNIEVYERALEVLRNYDSRISIDVISHHNDNTKQTARVTLESYGFLTEEDVRNVLNDKILKKKTELLELLESIPKLGVAGL